MVTGFYCPGRAFDHQTHGAEPIIIPAGQSFETIEVEETVDRISGSLAVDGDIQSFDERAFVAQFAAEIGGTRDCICVLVFYPVPVLLLKATLAQGCNDFALTLLLWHVQV